MEFFSRFGRLFKLVGMAIPPLILIAILNSIFAETLFTTVGASLMICLMVGILNWLFIDLLKISFLEEGFGRFIKIVFFFIVWVGVAFMQFYFITKVPVGTEKETIFSGNYFIDALCLGSSFGPFVMIYYGYLASLDEIDVEELCTSPAIAVGVGLVIGFISALLFSNVEFLQKNALWIVPILCNGLIIFSMVRHKTLPYCDFTYSYQSSSQTNIISGVKDFFKKY